MKVKLGDHHQIVYRIPNIMNFLSDVEKLEKLMSKTYTDFHREAVKNLFVELRGKSKNVQELTNDIKLQVGLLSFKEEDIDTFDERHKRIAIFLGMLKNGRKMMNKRMIGVNIGGKLSDEKQKMELLHGVNERTRYLSENVRKVFEDLEQFGE